MFIKLRSIQSILKKTAHGFSNQKVFNFFSNRRSLAYNITKYITYYSTLVFYNKTKTRRGLSQFWNFKPQLRSCVNYIYFMIVSLFRVFSGNNATVWWVVLVWHILGKVDWGVPLLVLVLRISKGVPYGNWKGVWFIRWRQWPNMYIKIMLLWTAPRDGKWKVTTNRFIGDNR